jgi:DNA-binding GntR family transcriptional regulator
MPPREGTAPYKAIAADLRGKIESGELRPGEQVPSATRICELYGVTKNTALRALKVLQDEGLIRVEQGWGSFVSAPEDR